MTTENGATEPRRWIDWLLAAAMVGAIALVMIGLLAWELPFGANLQLEAGEVAPYDVVSPTQITYESQVQTERARERAALAVADQYDVAGGRIRRQQVERARDLLEYITIVRQDRFSTPELQTDYLLAVEAMEITPELAEQILALSDDEWRQAVSETPAALDRVMRDEIRENTLAAARRRVPVVLDTELSEPVAPVVTELVRSLIVPNSVLNVARTEELRERARQEAPTQMTTIEAGEVILRAGDIATPEDVEALTEIGLRQGGRDWWQVARAALFTLVVLALIGAVLYRLRPQTLTALQDVGLLTVLALLWLVVAKFMLIPHDWLPYLYPLPALAMIIAVLIDLRVAVVFTIAFSLVAVYLSGMPVLAAYTAAGALLGSVIIGRAERLVTFLWAAVVIAASNLVIMAAWRAPYTELSLPDLVQLQLVLLLNGGLSASLALIGYFAIGNAFGIITSLQLTELSRPTHPLLRQLLLKSPGTYHHTIVVSNMAERAAATIGADAFLVRVGAYYHDIGKTVRPYFFTENILDGDSPHEKLDPLTSAQIIISHVKDGLDLAEKYRLPRRIRDFIREHHGRTIVRYFYVQAQRAATEETPVNEEDFRYPGPNPRSKETAILMLADTCEAAVRSIRPETRKDLQSLITRLIDERVAEGELNECNLTFKELQTIKDVFVRVLEGVHHLRIPYPESASGFAPLSTAPAELRPGGGKPAAANGAAATPGGVEEIVEGAASVQDVSVEVNT